MVGKVVGAAPSLALCAARTPQFSRISLRCWDLHWHLSIWHSPHSHHVRFPFSDLRGTQRQGPEREGTLAALLLCARDGACSLLLCARDDACAWGHAAQQ